MVKALFVFLTSFLLFAEDWDAKFAEVCKRDSMCSRLKATDGTWFKPKPEIIALLKNSEVQAEIKNASAKYGVDPTAVAGAIVAENSLNVGVKDSVQTWLASKMGITSIAGKGFSFGLGQISLSAAREAENYIAKLENRTPKSDSELTQEIADPMGSIKIAATIVRKVQDDYKNQGFDISKDPGVLTSLYNLGQSERRAKEAKAEGRLPQVNYFGLFVDKYSQDIRSAAKVNNTSNASTPLKTVVQKIPESPIQPAVSQKPDMTLPLMSQVERSNKNLVKTAIVTKSVPIVSAPFLCEASDYGQDLSRETKTSSFGAPVGVLDKDESFVEVSSTLDCKSHVWKLIKGRDNKVGWIQDEQLEKAKGSKLDNKVTCNRGKAEIACKKNIEKFASDLSIDSKKSEGLIYLKPISNTKEGKVSFKNEDFYCGNRIPETTAIKSTSGIGTKVKLNISIKELKSLSENLNKFANKELTRMSKELGIPIDQLTEPDNPYSTIAFKLDYIRQISKECLRTISSESLSCQDPRLYSKEYQDQHEKIQYEKVPNLTDVALLNQSLNKIYNRNQIGISNYFTSSTYIPDEDELKLITHQEIKESISDCNERIKELKKTAETQNQQQVTQAQYSYDQVISAADKATDDQLKAHLSEFVTFAKFCHARLNLLNANKKQNKINCSQAPKFLTNEYKLYAKELVVKLYQQNPMELINEVQLGATNFISQNAINDILGVPTPIQQPLQLYNNYYGSSYCPNKTAEYIEELVKNNPCIKNVYVPTRYLSNKLNHLDSKVIYRQFEEDGKYAIEIGDGTCK